MKTLGAVLCCLLALSLPARALALSSDADDAGTFYARGQEECARGRYLDAVAAFQRGYALTNQPRFLLAMAGAYRTSGDLPRARDYYRRFLREAPDNDPDRVGAAGDLRALEPVVLQEAPLRPVDESDGGRTQAEIKVLLGDQEYARYLASHLTLAGFQQRDRGNTTALEGGAFGLGALGTGVVLVFTTTEASRWRAVLGYTVIAVGFPIGMAIMRYGFVLSTAANAQVRAPHFAVSSPDGHGLAANVSFRF